MGSMSASDAAPLPRLGEVFFDVRGSSRSMRLSWYSDTGVAVFSIWQGGTCTGTFRLPIDDLPRMVDALQRGPRGSGPPGGDAPDLTGLPGGRSNLPEAPAPYAEFATGQHLAPVTGEFGRLDLAERETDPFGSGGYRPRSPSPEPVYSPAPPPSPSYRDRDRDREDPLTSPSFRDEARSGGYRQQAPAAPLPAPTPSPSYRDRDRDREDPL